jgi:prolyl oligopeptidase
MTLGRPWLALVAVCSSCASAHAPAPARAPSTHPPSARRLAYPPARRVDAYDVLHGVRVSDPYRWLEDGASPEVQSWMRAEDDLAAAELAKIPVRDALAARMKELAHAGQRWAPQTFGARLFYQDREAGKDRAVVRCRDGTHGDRVLLDPDAWSTDHSLFLGNFWPSWDGTKVVYQVSRRNADAAVLRVIDVDTGRISQTDAIEGGEWPAVSWTPASDGFYYQWVTLDPAARADRFARAEGRFHRGATSSRTSSEAGRRTRSTSRTSATRIRRGACSPRGTLRASTPSLIAAMSTSGPPKARHAERSSQSISPARNEAPGRGSYWSDPTRPSRTSNFEAVASSCAT